MAGTLLLIAGGASAFGYGLQQLVNSAVVAAFYSLLAVAYALLHGITGRVVISFGDIGTFGAFVAVYTMFLSMSFGIETTVALALVLLLAGAAAAALGNMAQRAVFAPLARMPGQALMIASVGLSIALQEAMRVQSGAREQWLPPYLTSAIVDGWPAAYPVRMTAMQGAVVLLAFGALAALLFVMRATHFGRQWRAVAQNRRLAELCGVDAGGVMLISAMAAAALAGAAGWIAATAYGGVGAYMGFMLGLKALFAAIIGGFGRLSGAALGGIVLALLETLWSAYFPALYRDVAVFGFIVMVIVLLPGGILGSRDSRESEP